MDHHEKSLQRIENYATPRDSPAALQQTYKSSIFTKAAAARKTGNK